MSKKPRPVTQYDVARVAGVSQRTVSRCFTQPEAVGAETRERVLGVARRSGYHPNTAARCIRCGRSECVTLLRDAEMQHDPFHAALLWSVHLRLREYRLHLTLGDLPSADRPRDLMRQMTSDGTLVLCHCALSRAADAYARDLAVPVVWLNTAGAADCVYPDDVRAGREATEHLIGLGHRRIAFLDRPRGDPGGRVRYCNCRARQDGYRDAMASAGLEPVLLSGGGGGTGEPLLQAYRRILGAPDRPTGLVTCRKQEAQELVYAAYAGHGLRIPTDLSVVTFCDEPPGLAPRLTAWVTPWRAMGAAAVDMLVLKIQGLEARPASQPLRMELVPGETVGRAPN